MAAPFALLMLLGAWHALASRVILDETRVTSRGYAGPGRVRAYSEVKRLAVLPGLGTRVYFADYGPGVRDSARRALDLLGASMFLSSRVFYIPGVMRDPREVADFVVCRSPHLRSTPPD